MNKYGARKATRGMYDFDSQAEVRRFDQLCLLRDAGEITDLEVHPRFTLQPAFRRGKKTERAIVYEADFGYTEQGQRVIEDVKGGKATRTAAFEIKRKLLLYQRPDLDFRIVEA